MTYETQIRATFEDTIKYQNTLRKKLDSLEEANRCLSSIAERDIMFDLLSRATLGLGTDPVIIRLLDMQVLHVDNFEKFIGYLFYYEKNIVDYTFFYEFDSKFTPSPIEIKLLWRQIKINLLSVFPFAKKAAISMSKELIDTKKKVGFKQLVKNGNSE